MTLKFRHSLAIAGLLGTSLAGAFAMPAAAQTTTSKPMAPTTQSAAPETKTAKPPAAAAATSSKPETVEQRISELKTALKIKPDQEGKWDGVAKAMRENAAAMDKLVQEKRAKQASMTAVDDLKTYEDFTQAHLDGLKNLNSAFKALYDSMPADQKKNADQVFQSFGPTKSTQQG